MKIEIDMKADTEVIINLFNIDEIEDKMEQALENPDITPRDMIDIVLEDLAENRILIRSKPEVK